MTPLTITCAEADALVATNLNYTNGESGSCAIAGTELGVITGTFDECGGTLTQTWTFSDACNSISATQTLTVQPAPAPVFDPVTPLTITCAEADALVATNLNYTNGESGACAIAGTELGVITGTFDECGGTLTQTWTFSDGCNSITATQVLTVQPAPAPVFDPVTPLTITCAEADALVATNLNYTNGEIGACAIAGTELGVITGTFDECGGTLTQTWTFSDACNSITATQTLTVQPAPAPVFDPVTPLTITCVEADAPGCYEPELYKWRDRRMCDCRY